MSPPPVTRNPVGSLQQQQQQAPVRKQDLNRDDARRPVQKKEKHIDISDDIAFDSFGNWFGVQGEGQPISSTPQKFSDWKAEKQLDIIEERHQWYLRQHVEDLKAALDDVSGDSYLVGLRDLFDFKDDLGGHAICDPPQKASAWTCQTWTEARRLPFEGDIDVDKSAPSRAHAQPDTPTDLGRWFGGVDGFTDGQAICDPPQKWTDWHAEEDSMRPPFQTQAKHQQNVFMRRQQHTYQG